MNILINKASLKCVYDIKAERVMQIHGRALLRRFLGLLISGKSIKLCRPLNRIKNHLKCAIDKKTAAFVGKRSFAEITQI